MQEYVQKSITTTLPRRDLLLNGGELIQPTAPLRSGIGPSSGSVSCGSVALTETSVPFSGPSVPIRCDSALAVFTNEYLASSFVSQPSDMAITPMITATPSPRRIQTSKERERFMTDNTFFPASSAMPREVAAPSA